MMRSQGNKRSRDDFDSELAPECTADSSRQFSKKRKNDILPFRTPGTPGTPGTPPSSRSNSHSDVFSNAISQRLTPSRPRDSHVPPALRFQSSSPQPPQPDVDMSDSPGLAPQAYQNHLRPPDQFVHSPSLTANHGRVPTPIHTHFYPRLQPSVSDISSIDLEDPSSGLTYNYNPKAASERERSRRMPSPISEDEMDIGPPTPTIPGMQTQLSQLSVDENMELDLDGDSMGLGLGKENFGERVLSLQTPPASRRGRARSGGISAGANVGKRFVMGYREDCEKCRARVPGHFSHII